MKQLTPRLMMSRSRRKRCAPGPVSRSSRRIARWLTLAVAVALVSALPAAAESFTFSSDRLMIGNLIGQITVEGHSGRDFEVDVEVRGRDATPDAIRFEQREGTSAQLALVFPDERRFVYPEWRGRTSIDRRHWDRRQASGFAELWKMIFGRDITVRGSGSGMELWADVTVRVPSGAELEVFHGVGDILAADVSGDLTLDSYSGKIEASDIRGSLEADTGSGSVDVERVDGDLTVDTGSGGVVLSSISGRYVKVDTGSGSVRASEVQTDDLAIDTGSGRVVAERVIADDADIDTGSGSVRLMLDEMGGGRFRIDTGSGSITLGVPASASARVDADTGSGGIHIDVPDVRLLNSGRDHATFVIGSGDADIELDTGSGGIRVEASEG